MTIKAYAYVRYSDPSQSTGNSVARQTDMANAYAVRSNVVLDWSYRDDGVSAFHGYNRTVGDLGRFMADVHSGKITKGSHLLIEGFDRFSREDLFESLYTFLTVLRAGVVLVTLNDNQVWSAETLMGQSYRLFGVLPQMERAHGESLAKSTRTLDNWSRRRAMGVVVDRLTKPAWIDVIGSAYEINEGKKLILTRIFTEIAAGIGADSVARRLNEDGVAAWGPKYKDDGPRAGKTRVWHGSYIQTLLNGRQIIGEHQHHQYAEGSKKRVPIGDPIPGYFPPAISLDLYHRAKAAFQSRSLGGGRKATTLVNVFGDLARCAHCEARMRWNGTVNRSRDGKSFVYLICSSNRQRLGCTHSERHRLEYIDNAVLSLITEIRLEGVADDSEAKAVLAEAIHQRNAAQERASTAGELVLEMKHSTVMKRKLVEAEDALALAEAAIEVAEQKLALVRTRIAPTNHQNAITELRRIMAHDPDVKHRIRLQGAIRSVMDKITFDRDGSVVVTLMGGLRVYRFKLAKDVKRFEQFSNGLTIKAGFVRSEADFEAFKEERRQAA